MPINPNLCSRCSRWIKPPAPGRDSVWVLEAADDAANRKQHLCSACAAKPGSSIRVVYEEVPKTEQRSFRVVYRD